MGAFGGFGGFEPGRDPRLAELEAKARAQEWRALTDEVTGRDPLGEPPEQPPGRIRRLLRRLRGVT